MTTKSVEVAGKSLVGFEVGGVPYAVDIQRVREILRPLPTLPLPHVPKTVVGVVDHRGDVVPIIDLRIRFGLEQRTGREVRWIIVSRGARLSGLVVDRVTEVFGASNPTAREVPDIEAGQEARGIVGAYSHRGRLVFVLDADKLTAIAETIDLPELPSESESAHE